MERLEKIRDLSPNRFIFVDGIYTLDHFITQDYRELAFEDALFEALRAQEFKRIVFCGYDRRIYFKDKVSEELSSPAYILNKQSQNPDPDTIGLGMKGPLGNKKISNRKAEAIPTGYNGIDNASMVRTLDFLMRDTKHRTAIVITQAEQTLDNLEQGNASTLRIGRWTDIPSVNENVCVMVFAGVNLKNKIEDPHSYKDYIPIREFSELLANDKHTGYKNYLFTIPSAEEEEVNRMIHYIRLKYKKMLDWIWAKRIVRRVCNDGAKLNQWMSFLRNDSHSAITLDLINQQHASKLDAEKSWEEILDGMVGMDKIKVKIQTLLNYFSGQLQPRQSKKAKDPEPIYLNMALLGNPGTGKTTVGELMGAILSDIGALKKGHLVKVTPSEIVRNTTDATSLRTEELVHQALDGVLFIDEAYQLTSSSNFGTGQAVIDALVPLLDKYRDRFALVVAGYKDQMQSFLENQAQPGISRRIPAVNRIVFEDLNPEQLFTVFSMTLKSSGFETTPAFDEQMKHIIKDIYKRRDENNFGNAGAMKNLANEIQMEYANKLTIKGEQDNRQLDIKHIPENYHKHLPADPPDEKILMNDLNNLIGLNAVKENVTNLLNRLITNQKRKELGLPAENQSLNLVFTGNSGTGKTTVARIYAKMLQKLGIILYEKTHVVRPADLIAGFVGQTAPKALKQFEQALDGVLFIDEAHNLAVTQDARSYNQDVITSLMQFMDKYKDRVVVIVAGYPTGIDAFLKSDPGLGPRFSNRIHFEDYSAQNLLEIFKNICKDFQVFLPPVMEQSIQGYFETVKIQSGTHFENARAAQKLFDNLRISQDKRYLDSQDAEDLKTFLPEDLEPIMALLKKDQPVNYKHVDLTSQLPNDQSLGSLDAVTSAVGLVRVKSTKDASVVGTGSGFIVSPKGIVVTAHHVVDNCDSFTFRLNSTEKEIEAKLLGFDRENDLAILTLPEDRIYPFLPISSKDDEIPLSMEILTIGYPLGEQFGQEITITNGTISSIRDDGRTIQLTSPVTHGNSGGPVVRKHDLKVIGVLCAGAKDTRAQMNFATNIKMIHELFGVNPVGNR